MTDRKQTVPFDVMVLNLFKVKGFNFKAEAVMHAAIGILGEVIELMDPKDAEEFIEELGDLEFYVTAGIQSLYPFCANVSELIGEGFNDPFSTNDETADRFDITMENLTRQAGKFHDLAKKCWVYGQPVTQHSSEMIRCCGRIRHALVILYDLTGTNREEVLGTNQSKLGKRYPEGVYRDVDAEARADKS